VSRVRATIALRLGWSGLLGLALLLGSGLFYWFVICSGEAELKQLRNQESMLRSRLQRAQSIPAADRGPAEQLETFYSHFPDKRGVPVALKKIYAAADRHNLQLAKGEYRLIKERDAKLARYQITLPITGSYSRMRGFAAEVLRELPFASLDDISMERDAIANPQVEARVRFTLYLGEH
jgi:hypothetical protein